MQTVFYGYIIFLLLSLLGLIKNQLVHRNSLRAVTIILAQKPYRPLLAKYRPAERYDENFFHPFRWTFDSMFPGLAEYKIKKT